MSKTNVSPYCFIGLKGRIFLHHLQMRVKGTAVKQRSFAALRVTLFGMMVTLAHFGNRDPVLSGYRCNSARSCRK